MVRDSFDFDVISDPVPPRAPRPDAGATVGVHGLLVPHGPETPHDTQQDPPRAPA